MKIIKDLYQAKEELQKLKTTNKQTADSDVEKIIELIDNIISLIEVISSNVKGIKWYEVWKFWPVIQHIIKIIDNW